MISVLIAALAGTVVGTALTLWRAARLRPQSLASLLEHLAAIEALTRQLDERVSEFEARVVDQSERIEQLVAENRDLRTQLTMQATCTICARPLDEV